MTRADHRILLIMFIIVLLGSQAFAWLRDADIKGSRDCLSIGYNSLDSINFAAEKIIDRVTSIGLLHLPGKCRSGLTNAYEVTYNKQFAAGKEGEWSYSWMLGAIYADSWLDRPGNSAVPWLGIALSRQISDIDRMRLSFNMFDYFEYARKLDDNKEIAFCLGSQMFNFKFMF